MFVMFWSFFNIVHQGKGQSTSRKEVGASTELKNEPSKAQTFYGLHEFLNMRQGNVPEHLFPSGFYVFSRPNFI